MVNTLRQRAVKMSKMVQNKTISHFLKIYVNHRSFFHRILSTSMTDSSNSNQRWTHVTYLKKSKTRAWLPVVTNRSLYNEPWGEVSCRSIVPSWPLTAKLSSRATMSDDMFETWARANSYCCLLSTKDKLTIDNLISALTVSPSPVRPVIHSHTQQRLAACSTCYRIKTTQS